MQIKSNAMAQANKTVNVFTAGYFDFDIRHSLVTTVTKDILGSNRGYLTIEPGKYRVTFNSIYDSISWHNMYINYYTKSGEQIQVRNTADGISGINLETVTHEVDFTNIGDYNNDTDQPFTVFVSLGTYREGSTIIFEAID